MKRALQTFKSPADAEKSPADAEKSPADAEKSPAGAKNLAYTQARPRTT